MWQPQQAFTLGLAVIAMEGGRGEVLGGSIGGSHRHGAAVVIATNRHAGERRDDGFEFAAAGTIGMRNLELLTNRLEDCKLLDRLSICNLSSVHRLTWFEACHLYFQI
jgi:hypothetical protein